MAAQDNETSAGLCPPNAAGLFYPAAREHLSQAIRGFLAGGLRPAGGAPAAALIVPHAGYVYSGRIAGRAYACVDGMDIERVVVLAPSHGAAFPGLGVGLFRAFQTPLGDLPVDVPLCQELVRAGVCTSQPEAFRGEHAVEVQLPFLQTVCPTARLVPLLCGDLRPDDTEALAAGLADVVPRAGTLWVVSSDFTHYGAAFGYVPFTQDALARVEQLDRGVIETILRRDRPALLEYLRSTGATVCGADAMAILLALLPRLGSAWDSCLLEYTQSGRLEHDDRHSVGYAAIAFSSPAAASQARHSWQPGAAAGLTLVHLARAALAAEVLGQTCPPPPRETLPADLTRPGASFVSLHIAGKLRGCMGSIEARQPLYLDVIENALSAGFQDPRFQPIAAQEITHLDLEVSVLSALRRIADPTQFEVGRHGILLRRGPCQALYLPQVATEQGWNRQEALDHLCRKAGLPVGAWRQGAEFQVFEACVFRGGRDEPRGG
jgi:MEMO1 family protein